MEELRHSSKTIYFVIVQRCGSLEKIVLQSKSVKQNVLKMFLAITTDTLILTLIITLAQSFPCLTYDVFYIQKNNSIFLVTPSIKFHVQCNNDPPT
eukprot:UN00692